MRARYAIEQTGWQIKIHLVSILLEHLAGMEGSDCRFSNRADLPIQVVHDPLGKPQLLLGDCEGPAISFSEGGGKIWAALYQIVRYRYRCGRDRFIPKRVSFSPGSSMNQSFNMP